MTMDLILIIVLLSGFLMGYIRGGILQIFHLLGYVIAFVVARLFNEDFGLFLSKIIPYPNITDETSMWTLFVNATNLEAAFYNAIAFLILFFIIKFMVRRIAKVFNLVTKLPVIRFLNRVIGSGLGFLQAYLVLFVVLFLLALTPTESMQSLIAESNVATFIIGSTPVLSDLFKTMWF